MADLDPADHVPLLRMVWSPRCYEDSRPTTACFDSKDVLPEQDKDGHDRYVSADHEHEISKTAVDARIFSQSYGDKRESERRHEARFLRLICGELRSIPDRDGDAPNPLLVERDRVLAKPELGIPANEAHCAIRNSSAKSRTTEKGANRQYMEYLRKELMKKLRGDLSYDDVFACSSGESV